MASMVMGVHKNYINKQSAQKHYFLGICSSVSLNSLKKFNKVM